MGRYVRLGVVYALVWAITWYSARVLAQLGGASLWFLPAGLRFAVIYFLGWRGLLMELVTVWWVSAGDFLAAGHTFPALLSGQMAWINLQWLMPVLGYAVVLLPIRATMRTTWDFRRPVHSSLFVGVGLSCAALAALGGSYGLSRIGAIDAGQISEVWLDWWVGDFIGIVTLAPLLMVWVCPRLTHYLRGDEGVGASRHGSRQIGLVGPTVLLALVSLGLVYGLPGALDMRAELPFFALLLLAPLAGLALRFGLRGALLAAFVLDSGLVVMLAMAGQNDLALRFQLVMLAISLVGLWLGGVVDARQRTLQRYRDFSYASNDLLWEVDCNGHLLRISGRLAKHMALPVGQHWRALLAGAEPEHLLSIEKRWSRRQPFRHLEVALHTPGRGTRWIQLNGQPVWNSVGEWQGYRGTALDVSQTRRARMLLRHYNRQLQEQVALQTRELQNNERHLRVVLASAPVGVMELDAQERCCFINDNACTLLGCTRDSVLGKTLLDFVHPDDRDRVSQTWNLHRSSDTVESMECRLAQTRRWCALNWIPLNLVDDAVQGFVLVLTDITDKRQHEQMLWSLAHHDALTHLPNRSLFMDRCEQALNLAKRNKSCVVVMWLDLDGFKEVNDALGHAAGDQLLKDVAQRLSSRIRDVDTVARMGGDEFAVVMSGLCDLAQSEKMAAEMVAILAPPFELREGRVTVTASVGVAMYPQDASTVENLIRCADLAMYAAKRGGKNQEQSWTRTGLAPLE